MTIYLTLNKKFEMKSKLDTHELAWAAGFFDGEGTTFARPNKYNRLHMAMSISQASINGVPETLIRFQKAIGNWGKIYGNPAQLKRKNRQPLYSFQITNEYGVCFVISVLWPYLGTTKKEQAIKAGYLKKRQLTIGAE